MTDKAQLTLHDDGLERQILSNLMSYSDLMAQYQDVLSEEMFYHPKHQILFRAIKAIADGGDFPDVLNVGMYFMKNPQPISIEAWEIADISSCAVTSVNFGHNVEILWDMAKRRRYYILGNRLISAGTDFTVDIDVIDVEIDKIREQNLIASKDVFDMHSINEALTTRVQQNCKDDKATMIPTGFSLIDEKGGFQLTDFNVIGGSTSMGKTTLAVNMLVNVAKAGIPSMFFTLEMTIEQLAARINAPLSGVGSSLMLYKKLRTDQIRDFERAKAISDKLPIYIDDKSTKYEMIKDSIRSNAIKRGIKIFFIDYLQVLSSTSKRQESEASFFETISREFKNLAKELRVCIVALSQLNREAKDTDPRPALSKIKASSGIEQAADTVLFIYRPGYFGKKHKYRPDLDEKTTAELIIAKGRNIGTGSGYVGFKGELSQFYDLTDNNSTTTPAAIPTPTEEHLPF